MSTTPAGKRDMLNGLSPTFLKLHTGYPGLTGANEVTGGAPAYAAKACTYVASVSGEARQLSASITFDVPACSVKWASAWNSTEMLFIAPTGGSPKEFVCDLTTNYVISPAHGLVDGNIVVFFLDTPPSPLVAGTEYYVVGATTDQFQVAATFGGAGINLTAQSGQACLASKLVTRTYAAQDTHTVSTFPVGAPN